MIAFWAVAGALAAAAAGLVLFRSAHAASDAASADPTSAVYRRQLAEIDELAERGLIDPAERKSAHAEAARRLLGAADAQTQAWSTDAAARRPVLLTVLVACLAALGLYVLVGWPGMPDQPFAQRLAAWRAADPATLNPPEMAAVLAAMTRERPNDPQAYRFLAIAHGASQNIPAAVRAMRQAVRLAPDRADLWEMLGEALVAEGNGQVTPDAQVAFRRALARDPKTASARFHLARAQIAAGDKAGGLAAWRTLLAELPPSDVRRAELIQAIAEAEGQPKTVEASAPPAGQLPMIQGMVQGLAQRLKANPDDPDGWVRLVRAYAVLGDAARRDQALSEAKTRYAGRPDILAQLEAAAHTEPMS